MKLIRIQVQKRFIWPVRIFFFLLFLYFANATLDILIAGKYHRISQTYQSGEVFFYVIVATKTGWSLLCYWLATLGTTIKNMHQND